MPRASNPKRQRVTMQAKSAFAGPGETTQNRQFLEWALSVKHVRYEMRSQDGYKVKVGHIVWVRWKDGDSEDYIGR